MIKEKCPKVAGNGPIRSEMFTQCAKYGIICAEYAHTRIMHRISKICTQRARPIFPSLQSPETCVLSTVVFSIPRDRVAYFFRSFQVVFQDACQALHCAMRVQEDLLHHHWPLEQASTGC